MGFYLIYQMRSFIMNRIYLSKSKYCQCVQCKKMFWLGKYRKYCAAGEDKTAIFETGHRVGELAKGLFGDYEDVPFDITLTPMIERTNELLPNKPNVITEASFSYDNNFCSVDILKNDEDGVEIYEVKSSTSIHDPYWDDASYQYYVLSNLGYNVKKVCIVHINNKYVQEYRRSKAEYLEELERCFKSNEFINIRFADNTIEKAGRGGEVYGIHIKQDYYSTNYGDNGYLFLMVDLNDPKQPIIKVRVWMPERDPDFFGLSNF